MYQLPRTPSSTNTSAQPFSEIWHNNEPLIITSIHDVPLQKNSRGHCGNEFPRGPLAIIPFDIIVSHRERWEYLNRNRTEPDEPKFLKSPFGKLTTRFYCVKSNCIKKRFPYYKKELVEISHNLTLIESHKQLLRHELELTL